jgi:endothelin-converting enzyme/putative endopeptidase
MGTLARIEGLRGKRDIAPLMASLHLDSSDAGLLFGFGSGQDFDDSEQVIAFATGGGLGLPDRDYYLKPDARFKDFRAKYLAHVERMLVLSGTPKAKAHADAAQVMAIETAIAKGSLTRTEKRDPHRLHHRMTREELAALTPAFDWSAYLKGLDQASLQVFNVTEPAFYRAVNGEIAARPLPALKAYLRWHVVSNAAPRLSRAFVDENFAFFARTLRGVQALKPRWKRCVAYVDGQLGEALGQTFVKRTFAPSTREKALAMTRQVEQAMAKDIESLDWMSTATKARALEKLRATVNKIGYPDRWRDYSSIAVARDDFFGNTIRGQRFESRRDLAKIGKPLDRGEWQMTPPTVNAYYDAQMNDINFPAGVLQPPLFDPRMDDAPNYGNTGGTVGHELTHGFDDEGRQFDAKGNLKDWWTEADARAFTERAQCVASQYAQYTIIDDIKINSQLTLGEDVADLGGLILAWMAWKTEIANNPPASRDGMTPEQRFFVGYAQWACENERPESARAKAVTDPHSPGRWRVNGLMVNVPEFQQAFGCKAGQPMVAQKRCRVW